VPENKRMQQTRSALSPGAGAALATDPHCSTDLRVVDVDTEDGVSSA
jgi:hypothetical protein